uniref:PHD-type domain-containing protein n=1 Tax=Rhabditophanes sp. KR3021 TaxID=114890 RepID=A0AC35TW97_9BILA
MEHSMEEIADVPQAIKLNKDGSVPKKRGPKPVVKVVEPKVAKKRGPKPKDKAVGDATTRKEQIGESYTAGPSGSGLSSNGGKGKQIESKVELGKRKASAKCSKDKIPLKKEKLETNVGKEKVESIKKTDTTNSRKRPSRVKSSESPKKLSQESSDSEDSSDSCSSESEDSIRPPTPLALGRSKRIIKRKLISPVPIEECLFGLDDDEEPDYVPEESVRKKCQTYSSSSSEEEESEVSEELNCQPRSPRIKRKAFEKAEAQKINGHDLDDSENDEDYDGQEVVACSSDESCCDDDGTDSDKDSECNGSQHAHTPLINLDSLCSFCLHDNLSPYDTLLECKACTIKVHENCYYVKNTFNPTFMRDKEMWFCNQCLSNTCTTYCIACHHTHGPMKQTSNGWIHGFCALFNNNIFETKVDDVNGPFYTLKSSLKNKGRCEFCEFDIESCVGLLVKCETDKCGVKYHPMCGLKCGATFKQFKDDEFKNLAVTNCPMHVKNKMDGEKNVAAFKYSLENLVRDKNICGSIQDWESLDEFQEQKLRMKEAFSEIGNYKMPSTRSRLRQFDVELVRGMVNKERVQHHLEETNIKHGMIERGIALLPQINPKNDSISGDLCNFPSPIEQLQLLQKCKRCVLKGNKNTMQTIKESCPNRLPITGLEIYEEMSRIISTNTFKISALEEKLKQTIINSTPYPQMSSDISYLTIYSKVVAGVRHSKRKPDSAIQYLKAMTTCIEYFFKET